MLLVLHIKTDGIEAFPQLLKHVIHFVVRWLVFDSFEDFAQSSELRSDLSRFFHRCGVLVPATGSRGRRLTACVGQRSWGRGTYDHYSDNNGFDRDNEGISVLSGELYPYPRAFDDDVCCLLLI